MELYLMFRLRAAVLSILLATRGQATDVHVELKPQTQYEGESDASNAQFVLNSYRAKANLKPNVTNPFALKIKQGKSDIMGTFT